MGFADLSILELIEQPHPWVEKPLPLKSAGTFVKNPQTRLASEDAKAIIPAIMTRIWLTL